MTSFPTDLPDVDGGGVGDPITVDDINSM
jgi:hypothetical protein